MDADNDAAASRVDMSEHFGSGGHLLELTQANPVPEFDERIEFYEYLVSDAQKRKVAHPIDHDTGAYEGELPPGTHVAEHKYFVDGVMQDGSATGHIHSFFEHFDAPAQSARIAASDRALIDEAYKYYRAGAADMEAAWSEVRGTDARLECRALFDAAAGGGDPSEFGFDARTVALWRRLYTAVAQAAIAAAWTANGRQASLAGRDMHRSIEMCYNRMYDVREARFHTPAMRQFYNFHREFIVPHRLRPWRTELSMFFQPRADVPEYLCGQCDGAFIDADSKIWLFDWKRSKEIKQRAFRSDDTGRGPCVGLPNCNLYHYYMQINTYRHMLERNTAWRVAYGAIVCFHPNQDDYALYEVPDYQARVARALAQYDSAKVDNH